MIWKSRKYFNAFKWEDKKPWKEIIEFEVVSGKN